MSKRGITEKNKSDCLLGGVVTIDAQGYGGGRNVLRVNPAFFAFCNARFNHDDVLGVVAVGVASIFDFEDTFCYAEVGEIVNRATDEATFAEGRYVIDFSS